ncbi:fluoride efflux transporter FluC [Streptomyces acidicola]|uniref:fluoride efflux transporter FluC n=1 Tax=Streptomyces acidicola TaxID=2596892 RepID=UPI00379E2F74
MPSALQHFIGPGRPATLSTYSTFSFEIVRLTQTGARLFAAANIIVSVVGGLAGALLGWTGPTAEVAGTTQSVRSYILWLGCRACRRTTSPRTRAPTWNVCRRATST